MKKIELEIDGDKDLFKRLTDLAAALPEAAVAALREELEIEREESMRKTPVDTGALRASHVVSSAVEDGVVVGRISVGGAAAPYALAVHEDLEAIHPVGEAKFLESTLREAAPHLAQRLAKRLGLDRLVR